MLELLEKVSMRYGPRSSMIVDRGRRLTRKFRDHWKEKIREAGVLA